VLEEYARRLRQKRAESLRKTSACGKRRGRRRESPCGKREGRSKQKRAELGFLT
jgi:hypothetical protein